MTVVRPGFRHKLELLTCDGLKSNITQGTIENRPCEMCQLLTVGPYHDVQ